MELAVMLAVFLAGIILIVKGGDFFVDAASGELYMVTDEEYTGPGFRLRDGELEVVLNGG